MEALKLTLPSECTDVTIPTETELIFKVLKKGNGSGLSFVGFYQYEDSPNGKFPYVEIVKGEGQLYVDKEMTSPTHRVDTALANRRNYFYIKAISDVLYLKFSNAQNIRSLYTPTAPESTRSFFAPLSENSPVMDAYLSDFFNAVRLENLTITVSGAETKNPQYYHGDLYDLSHIKPLNMINFENQKHIAGNINDLQAISNKNMISMFVSKTNIEGTIQNKDDIDTGFNLMSAVFAQNTPNLSFHTSAFKNRTYMASGNTSWGVTSLQGDLSDLPKVHSLYFRVDKDIKNLVYSRSRSLEFTNLREFSIIPKMNLGMLEFLVADLSDVSKVSFVQNGLVALFVEDSEIDNVSQATKDRITELRSKGIIFTTNIIV